MNFTENILHWYRAHGRELPWRGTRDPYRIWLSEVILQQTRIAQGMDYWLRFVERWPTVHDLACASEDEVLRMWQGLGYYSRARNLHQAAQQVDALGHFPDTLQGLHGLKGVGDYTAAAIASMAFGIDAAVVDGNVYRVLARHYGIDTPINTTQGKRLFTELAQSLLPAGHAAEFNQGMMDFGAIQCTPQSPRCDACPLADTCDALHTHRVDQLPVKQKKTAIKIRRLQYVYIHCQGQTAIHRRPAGDIWQGLWEPLLIEDQPLPQFEGEMTLLRQGVKHVLTHRILLADFWLLETDQRPTLPQDYIWVNEADLDKYALPRLIEKLVTNVPSPQPPKGGANKLKKTN